MAVNIAMMIIPTRIHTMQKIRARNDLGARSPYLNSKGMSLLSRRSFFTDLKELRHGLCILKHLA